MDYKKLYNEAKERFKVFKEKYYTRDTYFGDIIFDKTGEMKKEFESIFPELRESEDERIRKEIINYILYKAKDVSAEQEHAWISYLEKQKEQKSAEWSLEDDHIIGFVYDLLNEIEWKDEWAMSKEECLRLLSNYSSQKPAEWSEEDEKNLELVVDCVYEYYPDPVMKYKLKDWLKSLRPSWKPSEGPVWRIWENGACGNSDGIPIAIVKAGSTYRLVSCLGAGGEKYIMLSDLEKLPGFDKGEFETAKQEPHWKPSGEQMEQLKSAAVLPEFGPMVTTRKQFPDLVPLYNDLKKLM